MTPSPNKELDKLAKQFLSFQRKFNGKTIKIKVLAENVGSGFEPERIDKLLRDAVEAHHEYEDNVGGRIEGPGPLAERVKKNFIRSLKRNKNKKEVLISRVQLQNLKELDRFFKSIRK